ncbi:DNA-directed DNA/RNA polymerase mu [Polyodon spathula]|uniref:DNA-directed DNA/RNA polymerase mu n=1 Tax=Polyodon spathula TaxID=7913 RepID=UPI001B7D9AC1|nr:DNA-directed DNA/RNA polymerase mu [Polyodon spathula]
MVPLKRRRKDGGAVAGFEAPAPVNRFPGVEVFLLERRMGSSRRAFLTQLARRKGFKVQDTLGDSVTHLVSESNSGDEVWEWLDRQTGGQTPSSLSLLDISWFTDSMETGRPVEILDRHRLQVSAPRSDPGEHRISAYACQRRTPLDHRNKIFTDALEVLAENAEFSESEGRGLAFRRAGSVLRSLPFSVSRMEDLRGAPCLGEHSRKIIQEILEDGVSGEVEGVLRSERYRAMKALTGIFGVGVKTADRWAREGLRTPGDLLTSGHRLSREQEAGVRYYEDLNCSVTRAEADTIGEIVKEAVHSILPGARVTLTGGFRRGKEAGHDVDLLITHPEEGKEEGLLGKLTSWLDSQGVLLYQRVSEGSEGQGREAGPMDHFNRSFSILKLGEQPGAPPGDPQPGASSAGPAQEARAQGRGWRAVRVDLVICPYSQFAYALLGWTGSQQFERDLRRFASQERDMSLNSHGLYQRERVRNPLPPTTHPCGGPVYQHGHIPPTRERLSAALLTPRSPGIKHRGEVKNLGTSCPAGGLRASWGTNLMIDPDICGERGAVEEKGAERGKGEIERGQGEEGEGGVK